MLSLDALSHGLTWDQISNAYETWLWWRLTPSTSLNSVGKWLLIWRRPKKEWLFLAVPMLLELTVFHWCSSIKVKDQDVWSKWIQATSLFITIPRKNHGWDSRLFPEWFHNRFVPSVRRWFCRCSGIEENVPLLLDNAPSHPSASSLLRLGYSVHSWIIHELMKSLFLPAKSLATSINTNSF